MDDCLAEGIAQVLAECTAHVLAESFLTGLVLFVDKQVIQCRDTIIRLGRHTQALLRLLECMCVFAAEDPGMHDGDLRCSAEVLGLSFIVAAFTLCGVVSFGATIWSPWVLGFVFVNPACTVALVWLKLLLSKRRLHQPGRGQLDPGLEESLVNCCKFP